MKIDLTNIPNLGVNCVVDGPKVALAILDVWNSLLESERPDLIEVPCNITDYLYDVLRPYGLPVRRVVVCGNGNKHPVQCGVVLPCFLRNGECGPPLHQLPLVPEAMRVSQSNRPPQTLGRATMTRISERECSCDSHPRKISVCKRLGGILRSWFHVGGSSISSPNV